MNRKTKGKNGQKINGLTYRWKKRKNGQTDKREKEKKWADREMEKR
jgi:hypothetical protein